MSSAWRGGGSGNGRGGGDSNGNGRGGRGGSGNVRGGGAGSNGNERGITRGNGNGRGRGSYSGQARRDPTDVGGRDFPPLNNLGSALPQSPQASGSGGGHWLNGRIAGSVGNGVNGRTPDPGTSETAPAGRAGARRGIRLDPERTSMKYDRVMTRPGPDRLQSKEGEFGNKLNLFANYYAVKTKPDWAIFNHRVDILPDEGLETFQKKKLLRNLRDRAKELGSFIYDGTNLYAFQRIVPPQHETRVMYSQLANSDVNYQITLRLVAEVQPSDVVCIQFYNIIMRTCLQKLDGFEELGRHFFDANAAIEMRGLKLNLWPGYITTLRQHENNLLLCVEVTHKVLRQETCFDIIKSVSREKAWDELIGNVVITMYNRKTYSVSDILWDQNPHTTFPKRDGTSISLVNYFREKYPLLIQHNFSYTQPLLVSMPSKQDYHRGDRPEPVLLIPQLCNMTGLSDSMRNNFGAMRELSTHLQLPPTARVNRINGLMERLRNSPQVQEELDGWKLNFDSALVSLRGRVTDPEEIRMRSGNTEIKVKSDKDKADWTFALKSKQMFSSTRLSDWIVIVPQPNARLVDGLVKKLQQVGAVNKLDFQVQYPLKVYTIPDARQQSYADKINEAVAEYRDKVKMVFAILASSDHGAYSAVKKTCIVQYGIASQCFLAKHLTAPDNKLLSVLTKVAVQMNAKMGGEPWAVVNPMHKLNGMIVGFDVHHSGKGQTKKSVGAMVASTNANLTKYFSTTSTHEKRDDLSRNMTVDMQKCLRGYYERNNRYPSWIMFYRDGVGEGQLHYVKNTELDQLKAGIAQTYEAAGVPTPRITFTIVTKRGNSRIFTKQGQRDYGNPPPGTFVDNVITLPERYDFFLVAQESRQGTVSPTAYNVIYDEGNVGPKLTPDMIQRFTYKLCHLYYNWSGTVAVPAVCQYAHKLAYLSGLSLGSPSNERLNHFLYFL